MNTSADGNSTCALDTGNATSSRDGSSVESSFWHQNMELATICIANGLSVLIISTRVILRRNILKRFRKDDVWIAFAGLFLIFPLWSAQIGMNHYGSGLHTYDIPSSWFEPFWKFSWGNFAYFVVSSMIKISACACILEMLPPPFLNIRRLVYALCAFTMALSITESLIWLLQCQPLASNFNWDIPQIWCIDVNIFRYVWVGASCVIDLAIIAIPLSLFWRMRLKPHERQVLTIVFSSNLLGTFACAFGAYGVWATQNGVANDVTYAETPFVMCNSIEILMYSVGASATVISHHLVKLAGKHSARRLRHRRHPCFCARSSSIRPSWRRGGAPPFSSSPPLTPPPVPPKDFSTFTSSNSSSSSNLNSSSFNHSTLSSAASSSRAQLFEQNNPKPALALGRVVSPSRPVALGFGGLRGYSALSSAKAEPVAARF